MYSNEAWHCSAAAWRISALLEIRNGRPSKTYRVLPAEMTYCVMSMVYQEAFRGFSRVPGNIIKGVPKEIVQQINKNSGKPRKIADMPQNIAGNYFLPGNWRGWINSRKLPIACLFSFGSVSLGHEQYIHARKMVGKHCSRLYFKQDSILRFVYVLVDIAYT